MTAEYLGNTHVREREEVEKTAREAREAWEHFVKENYRISKTCCQCRMLQRRTRGGGTYKGD